MNIRLTSPSPYIVSNNKPKVAFGHNGGVIKALEVLQETKYPHPGHIGELQAQLNTADPNDPDFIKALKKFSDKLQKAVVRYARKPEIEQGLRVALNIRG